MCIRDRSILGPEKLAEFSYIGFNPSLKVTLENNKIKMIDNEGKIIADESNPSDLFIKLREILEENKINNNFNRLIGGLVGFISYDIVRHWENISDKYTELNYADFQFGLFNEGIIFDHEKERAYYYHSGDNNLKEVLELLDTEREIGTIDYTEPISNINKETFENNVDIAKEYVRSGAVSYTHLTLPTIHLV